MGLSLQAPHCELATLEILAETEICNSLALQKNSVASKLATIRLLLTLSPV